MLPFEDRINRARILLERKGQVSGEFLSREIRSSWQRCLAVGLDPLGEPECFRVEAGELEGLRVRAGVTLHLARIELRNLHTQIAGSNFAVVFANPQGVVLESMWDRTFDAAGSAERIAPGSVWSESVSGTNALGGVAFSGEASIVHAGEHFFRQHAHLTCAAAPIFSPEGTLEGIIDASSDCRWRQHHTLALVKMSCLTVENALFAKAYREHITLEFHNRREFLGTLQAGRLAFAEDGRLLAATRQARFLLHGLPLEPGTEFERLFGQSLERAIDAARGHAELALTDVHGSGFAAALLTGRVAPHRPVGRLRGAAPRRRSRPRDGPEAMVSSDPEVARMLRRVESATRIGAPILIEGETGTGKELLARFAHRASGRQGKFVALNCASLPETLVESELFGYRPGAFTGAARGGSQGLVVHADGGTLFLDEVGEMPAQLQARLLRLLDDWQVRALGDTAERTVDVQLVCATNRDLRCAVSEGRFRRDLWHRISAIEVQLPALRARADFAEVVAALVERIERPLRLPPGALELLRGYAWPGNVRELRNFLVRLAVEAGDGQVSERMVRAALAELASAAEPPGPPGPAGSRAARGDAAVRAAYRRHAGNVSAVARELGISRNTVYRRLRGLGLARAP